MLHTSLEGVDLPKSGAFARHRGGGGRVTFGATGAAGTGTGMKDEQHSSIGGVERARLSSMQDVRELRDKLRREQAETAREPVEGAHTVDRLASEPGAVIAHDIDGLELDREQLSTAVRSLVALTDEFNGYLREAEGLRGELLGDGWGPISHHMRTALGRREGGGAAESEAAVTTALRHYVGELSALTEAFGTAAGRVGAIEDEASNTFSSILRDVDEGQP